MLQFAESVAAPFHLFDAEDEPFGWPVRSASVVVGEDLCPPFGQCVAEGDDLGDVVFAPFVLALGILGAATATDHALIAGIRSVVDPLTFAETEPAGGAAADPSQEPWLVVIERLPYCRFHLLLLVNHLALSDLALGLLGIATTGCARSQLE